MAVKVNGDVKQILRDAIRIVAPPKNLPTYSEFAPRFVFPDGPRKGKKYDPSLDPVHAAVIKEFDKGIWRNIIGVGAVQTGKSLLLIALAMCMHATHGRQNVVYSQPTMPKIHEAWTGKIKPFITNSELADWMPSKGQGSRGSESPQFVQFTDPDTGTRAGILWFIPGGGSKEAAQAGVSAPLVLVDEVDSYQSRHRVELVAKRADSFRRKATRIFTSTVKKDQGSIILGMYEDSTASRLWFQCLCCGAWQPLEWENVSYDHTDDKTAIDSVRYNCANPSCGQPWDETDRIKTLKNYRLVHRGQTVTDDGTVVGDAPRTETFGILWTALDSTLRDLGTLALEHLKAMRQVEAGDHGPMRSFFRDQLCKMYAGEMEELEAAGPLTWQYLAARAAKEKWGPARHITDRDPSAPEHYTYSRHVVAPPGDATHTVGAVDVQHNRVYWVLRAFNREESSWIYGWGYEYARPDQQPADPQELRALLNRTYAALRSYAGETDLVLLGLDVGDNTENLRTWVQSTKTVAGTPWRACKGYTHHMKAEAQDIEGLCYWRDDLMLVQDGEARNLLHSTLRRPIDAPGATHMPFGLGMQDAAILRHLVSEQEGLDPKTKKRIVVRGTGRNDWLDCAKMTQALMCGYLLDSKAYEMRVVPKVMNEVPRPPPHPLQGEEGVNPLRIRTNLQSFNSEPRQPISRIQRRYGGFGSRGRYV